MSWVVRSAVREFPKKEYLKEKKAGTPYRALRKFESYLYHKHGISNGIRTERPSTRLERLYHWLKAKVIHPKKVYFGHSFTDTNRPTQVTLYFDKEIPVSEKDFWSQVDKEDHLLPVVNVFDDDSRFIPASVIKRLRAYIEYKDGKMEQERICHEGNRYKLGGRKIGSVREIFNFKFPERKDSKLSLTVFSLNRPKDPGGSNVKARYYIETPTDIDDVKLMKTLDILVDTVRWLYPNNPTSR